MVIRPFCLKNKPESLIFKDYKNVCLLSAGIICNFKQVHSQPNVIQRKLDHPSEEVTKLEEDIEKVNNQSFSFSENEDTRNFAGEGLDVNAYYSDLGNVLQQLLTKSFINDLPRTLVCLLAGKQDCGLEAELKKAVSLDLMKPLLGLVSSLRSQTCAALNMHEESNDLFRVYLRMGESAVASLNGFQHSLINTLSSLPLPGNLLSAVSSLVDVTMIYVLKFTAMLLQLPMDYIKIALQFGIRIPSLDNTETCEQGKTPTFNSVT